MSGFLAGLVLGAAAGALLGALWSPRSGQANRDLLMKRFPGLCSHGPELMSQVVEGARARLEEGCQAFQQAAAESRRRMADELEKARRGES